MKTCIYAFAAFIILSIVGCRNFSNNSIDEVPIAKIDNKLLGIWKAVGDSDKKNYLLIQNSKDIFDHCREESYGIYVSKISHNDYLDKTDKYYYLSRISGKNSDYQYKQFPAFLSTIGSSRFLNIEYHEPTEIDLSTIQNRYFFVKIIKVNRAVDTIQIAVVADPSLKKLSSSKAVRSMIEKNINKAGYYSDTIRFYKVSNYHATLSGSIKEANK